MTIDLYTSSGTKKGTLELPAGLFEANINRGLMHLALIRQQSNRRTPVAHVKHRGEVVGSTKKMFQQKHTGAARRGPKRSPLLKGGGKAFGPRSEANFTKEMPKKMRRAALFSCLSYRAKQGAIIGLEDYPQDQMKTKDFMTLINKLPVELGRKIVLVTDKAHRALELSARNVTGMKVLYVQYLNPEDILGAKNIIFLKDAVTRADEIFGKDVDRTTKKFDLVQDGKDGKETKEGKDIKEIKEPKVKKVTKKAPAKAKKSS